MRPPPTLHYKRLLRLAAAALFVAAVPLFLIATNVRWVINAPLLYSYGFDRHDSVGRTGIEREELLSAGRQIREYFNNDDEFITVSVIVGYSRVGSLFRTREVLHMRDVKTLVRGVYRVQELSAAFIAASLLAPKTAAEKSKFDCRPLGLSCPAFSPCQVCRSQ